MAEDPAKVVTAYYAAIARSDVEGAMACLSEDVELRIHVSPDVLPFGGVTVGRAAAEQRMRLGVREWDCERADPVIHEVGEVVRSACVFAFRHKASNARLEGSMHHVFVVSDGKIRTIDERLDEATIQAFVEIAKATMEARLRNHCSNVAH